MAEPSGQPKGPKKSLFQKFGITEPAPEPTASQLPRTTPVVQAPSATPSVYTAPVVDATLLGKLREAAFSKPSAYKQLLEAAETMRSVIGDDESKLFRAAAAILTKQGVTVHAIQHAFDIHLGLLEAERKRFQSTVDQSVMGEIASLKKRRDDLASQADGKRKEAVRLQAEAAELDNQRSALEAGGA